MTGQVKTLAKEVATGNTGASMWTTNTSGRDSAPSCAGNDCALSLLLVVSPRNEELNTAP